MSQIKITDITEYCQPGIFRIECAPTGRSLFVESENVFLDTKKFIDFLKAGICENETLLKDFEIYGIENFRFFLIVCGSEWSNPEKRKKLVELLLPVWDKELY